MSGKKWKKAIVVLLCTMFPLLGVFFTTPPAQGQWFDLSNFNPVGKALDPIEQLVPNLTIKGFLKNETRYNVHGKSGRSGRADRGLFGSPVMVAAPPGRIRKWDFDQIWLTGELEIRYRPVPNVELVNFWNMRYDAVFDWDHWWRDDQTIARNPVTGALFPTGPQRIKNNSIAEEMKYYHSHKRYMRELYANIFLGPVTLTVGKQQNVWGKIDFALLDIVNPMDGRIGNIKSLGADERWLRVPTWQLKGLYTFPSGNYYIEAIAVPDIEITPPLVAGHARDFNNPAIFPVSSPLIKPEHRGLKPVHSDRPSENIENWEWFFRLGYNISGWDGFIFYGYHWGKGFTNFTRRGVRRGPGLVGAGAVETERKMTRISSFGTALDKSFFFLNRNWTFLYEGRVDHGTYRTALNEVFRGIGDGVDKKDFMFNSIETDTFALQGKLTFLTIIGHQYVFGWNRNTPGPVNSDHRDDWFFFYGLSYNFRQLEDRLAISFNQRWRTTNGDNRSQTKVAYTFSDYLKAELTFHTWFGGNYNDIPDGIERDREMLDFRFTYNF